jgi:hypothetical protein
MRRMAVLLALVTAACSSSSPSTGPTPDGGGGRDGATDTGTGPVDSGGGGSDTGTDSPVNTDSGMVAEGGSETGPSEAGGDAGCTGNCIANNMAAFKKFEGYELMDCGCASGSACASMCTAECADPSSLTTTSPCGMCLDTQADMGESSSCTVSAGTSCILDSTCSAFVKCAMACP